ncbi:precorrin-6y C5,15-methyltransferase (decarboxylating) subunit CbiE [Tenacibaculum sp. M341]|uniref:precorrin-6y C5,15-methyltransferase (decarboxylating) subunit CbiE n=1 Tax=Tenacibaculum sp. M341 TaxID=2530339 RepID=UPI00104A2C68|nr:precorrin-6y C5,15-methyltransferase (decarboxylating) subunit CbiE [Tenacibaculum sp. M341]TCI93744.1 precorrin-6y C5,15-methyltransferase (decarboxylating) subunit CbiE [Tenacibaculum sp. M341]
MTFYVIGIPNKTPVFTTEQTELIQSTTLFSGGKRHYQLVKSFLPENHQWISISGPLQEVFHQYTNSSENIVVFASGNPLFYGISNTLRNKFPKAIIHTFPSFSSIQLLANKTNTNSNQLTTVSVHGRTWKALDGAVMQQLPLIGVLTDGKKNPKTISERLLQYGYNNYSISIGEDLDGTEEKVQTLSLTDALNKEYHTLNCVLLHKQQHRTIPFGIPNNAFKGLEGRPNMITKMPIRLTSLHYLNVLEAKTLWDIGFCTGSIAIEAKLRNPKLDIIAFEKRPECEAILKENTAKFGVMGIQEAMGDIFDLNFENFPKPDTIFIGGHGGRLIELIERIAKIVDKGTIIVINAVKEKSETDFENTCKNNGFSISEKTNITIDLHNPIKIVKAIKL